MDGMKIFGKSALNSPTKIVGFFVLILLVTGAIGIAFNNRQPSNPPNNDAEIQPEEPISKFSLLYGNWAGDRSQIFAYDMNKRQEYVLATLPINIKKVTQISDDELLFINETDEKDHGHTIGIYSLTTKKTSNFYTADEGFGIDDYQISPDKNSLAVWEVQFAPDTDTLRGGISHVYTTKITTPGTKNLLYDESATGPVHYPLAITNAGQVYLDRFLANSGAGWAYGMSTSDYTGTIKAELTNMTQGTYGTQPELSPNGQYLLFGGYNGAKGNGNDVAGDFRRALVSTNTVELLNTATQQRTSLPLSNENIYSDISWEKATGNIKLVILSKNPEETGAFIYNIDTQTLVSADTNENEANLITDLGRGVKLYGKNDETGTVMGNLGSGYAQPYTKIFAEINGQQIEIPTSVTLAQIIGISTTLNTQSLTSVKQASENNTVHLSSFEVKEQLKEKREYQQQDIPNPPNQPKTDRKNLPKCSELASAQCNDILNVNYTPEQARTMRQACLRASACKSDSTKDVGSLTEDQEVYARCVYTQWNNSTQEKSCTDSPLYLYGPQGTKVKVSINTPIFNTNIKTNNSQFDFTLNKNGLFTSNGKTYASLTYDYTQAIFTKPPTKGRIIKKSELEKNVKDYATKLGLNKKETNDLINDVTSKATKDYVFLSFYDQKTSKYMLPISFNPQPDTYINYVFYLKNLNTPEELGYKPEDPVFEKIEARGNFTAVEISIINN